MVVKERKLKEEGKIKKQEGIVKQEDINDKFIILKLYKMVKDHICDYYVSFFLLTFFYNL